MTELTGYKLAEQIMSLTGTLIVSWDSNGENSAITPIPPTMKAADFIKGTGSGNVKLNVCNPTPDLRSNRKAQCLEMRQDSIQFKGLSETIIETLLEIQRAVRNDTELTQDQRKLISMLGVNNIIPTLQTLSAAEGVQYINDISTIAAKNFTIELLSSVQNKMTNMTLPSEAMASFKDQLEKINQTFRNQIRSASEVQSIQNTEEKTVWLTGIWHTLKNGPMAIAGMVADMSNYTIYTIGDIDFVYTAFNGIALIFSSHGSNEWLRFAAYAAAIGLFYKSMKWVLAPTKNDVPIFSGSWGYCSIPSRSLKLMSHWNRLKRVKSGT